MRKKLIAGNWKMHGTAESAAALTQSIVDRVSSSDAVHPFSAELALFPPFVHLPLCANLLMKTSIKWGAQNVSEYPDGAYTGEISANMLSNLSCHYVIIGHSERRQYFDDTNARILKKCQQAFSAKMQPILCVGETLSQRESEETLSVIQEQLDVVRLLKDNCPDFASMVIAYEPVWAIGTGKTATPEQAQEVHLQIRAFLSKIDKKLGEETTILYGGSVKPDNAKALFQMNDIDGALVGGASLNADDFIKIVETPFAASHHGK